MSPQLEHRPMATNARETFVVGLRNAHAMEVQARELAERQSERLDQYPEVKARVAAHLQENEPATGAPGTMPAGVRRECIHSEGYRAILDGQHDGDGSHGGG